MTANEEQTATKQPRQGVASHIALANTHLANGQVQKAISLLEYLLRSQDREHAPESDADRLALERSLGVAYIADARAEDAVSLLQHVVSACSRGPNNSHSDILAVRRELASAHLANDQAEQAIMLLEQQDTFYDVQGSPEEDPARIASQRELARAYLANEQAEQAIALLEHHDALFDVLGNPDEDPARMASQLELARQRASGASHSAFRATRHTLRKPSASKRTSCPIDAELRACSLVHGK